MLATNDNARNNDDSGSLSCAPPDSSVRPRLRFESWDSKAFEAWESSFDHAYRPPPPAPAPTQPAPEADADAASAARPPIVEELEGPWQPAPDDGSLPVTAPGAASVPAPPSTLRGIAPSEPRLAPELERLPSLVATDRWPALGPRLEEELAPIARAPNMSPPVAPVVLAVETGFDSKPAERSTCEAPTHDGRRTRARRVRAWILAAAAVLVAPGLVGLFLIVAGATTHASSAPAHATRTAHGVEVTSSPLEMEARPLAPRPAAPAKAKPGRRSSKHRRR